MNIIIIGGEEFGFCFALSKQECIQMFWRKTKKENGMKSKLVVLVPSTKCTPIKNGLQAIFPIFFWCMFGIGRGVIASGCGWMGVLNCCYYTIND